MRLPLTKYDSIVLIMIIVPLTLSPLCLLLLVRLGAYTANLCAFYFYKLIGKLTAFLQLQEFSLHNLPVVSSTTAAQPSPHSSDRKWETSSPRLQHLGEIRARKERAPEWFLPQSSNDWGSRLHIPRANRDPVPLETNLSISCASFAS